MTVRARASIPLRCGILEAFAPGRIVIFNTFAFLKSSLPAG
jgi:hypothetical protein